MTALTIAPPQQERSDLQSPHSAFTRKVAGMATLNGSELDLLDAASSPVRDIPANRDLISEGDKPGPVFLILDGWACRYKVLSDGGRQIMALLLPGDFCDMHIGVLEEMDHSIGTLSACRVVTVSRERMDDLIVATPALTRAFWRAQLVDEGVLRSWIVSLGRRDSLERVAHLLLELYVRMRNIGLAIDHRAQMPLTQAVLADALGLTPVHLNRVLKVLREREVVTLTGGTLHIADIREMTRIAGFDDNYLHRRMRA